MEHEELLDHEYDRGYADGYNAGTEEGAVLVAQMAAGQIMALRKAMTFWSFVSFIAGIGVMYVFGV